MRKIYFISGLGADERVFKYLNIPDVESAYIHWEKPSKQEKIECYCKRLISQIDLSKEVILIGISFGGIVAQEISKIIACEKLIIISSIKALKELDWKLKLVSFLKPYKIIPSNLLKWSNALTADYYFGTNSKEESDLLKLIIKDTDRTFMKWAIDIIMRWNYEPTYCKNLIHIHGTKDRIFPIDNIRDAMMIENGGHFMIVNRAEEISKIISEQIQ